MCVCVQYYDMTHISMNTTRFSRCLLLRERLLSCSERFLMVFIISEQITSAEEIICLIRLTNSEQRETNSLDNFPMQ